MHKFSIGNFKRDSRNFRGVIRILALSGYVAVDAYLNEIPSDRPRTEDASIIIYEQ